MFIISGQNVIKSIGFFTLYHIFNLQEKSSTAFLKDFSHLLIRSFYRRSAIKVGKMVMRRKRRCFFTDAPNRAQELFPYLGRQFLLIDFNRPSNSRL